MGIKYVIEGPKGSGKSTLVSQLANHYQCFPLRFDSQNTLSFDKMEFIADLQDQYVLDRGYLSAAVYTFVEGYTQDKAVSAEIVDQSLIIKTWAPATQKEFIKYLELIHRKNGKLVILYASNHEDLFNRISLRKLKIKKGANEAELKALKLSNIYFKCMGEILSFIAESQGMTGLVETIDISKEKKVFERLTERPKLFEIPEDVDDKYDFDGFDFKNEKGLK